MIAIRENLGGKLTVVPRTICELDKLIPSQISLNSRKDICKGSEPTLPTEYRDGHAKGGISWPPPAPTLHRKPFIILD